MNPSDWQAPGSPAVPPAPTPPAPAPPAPAPAAPLPPPPPAAPVGPAPTAPAPATPLSPPPPPGSPYGGGRPGAALFATPTPAVAAPPAGSLAAGVIYGLVGGLLGGAGWYLAVILTKRQFVYLAVAVGAIVGTAVAKGTRTSKGAAPLVAAVITLATMCVSQYFIDRWAAIQYIEEVGSPARIPLFLSLPRAVDVVRAGLSAEPSQGLFWAIAVVLSFITARKYVH